jgi:hypothetical protein
VYKTLDNKEVCIRLFSDLLKAFDMVNRNIILQKLDACSIRGIAQQWFASNLNNKRQLVETDHFDAIIHEIQQTQSEEKIIQFGVPQGSF